MSNDLFRPGEDNRPAGEYVEVDARGNAVKDARQVTIQIGDRLPPTQQSGNYWKRLS